MNATLSPEEARTARLAERQRLALRLGRAISEAHPRDAAVLMTAALQALETDGPQHDLFGTARRDAEWWADIAPPHEVQAYVLAGLRQIGSAAIGPKARKEIFAALWLGMSAADRTAFLQRVRGE